MLLAFFQFGIDGKGKHFVSDVFFEAIAIYGLVGHFVGMAAPVSYGLMGVSLVKAMVRDTIRSKDTKG